MSRTLTISDELFERLETEAHSRGLRTVEELLAQIHNSQVEVALREHVVCKIDELREHLFTRYGQMPDSVDLLREDRAR